MKIFTYFVMKYPIAHTFNNKLQHHNTEIIKNSGSIHSWRDQRWIKQQYCFPMVFINKYKFGYWTYTQIYEKDIREQYFVRKTKKLWLKRPKLFDQKQ